MQFLAFSCANLLCRRHDLQRGFCRFVIDRSRVRIPSLAWLIISHLRRSPLSNVISRGPFAGHSVRRKLAQPGCQVRGDSGFYCKYIAITRCPILHASKGSNRSRGRHARLGCCCGLRAGKNFFHQRQARGGMGFAGGRSLLIWCHAGRPRQNCLWTHERMKTRFMANLTDFNSS